MLKTLVLASSLPTICTTVLLHWLRGGCCSNDWLHSNSVGFLWLQLNLAGDFYCFFFFYYYNGGGAKSDDGRRAAELRKRLRRSLHLAFRQTDKMMMR